jgi:hypothetical protein
MRTVLIGSDFMYNSVGNLIPIEINTNTGYDNENVRVEELDESFNLTPLLQFITDNGFTKIEYVGDIRQFYLRLSASVDIECNMTQVANAITVPFIEDNETTLIIRSAYDTTALIDDTYCTNKVNFLNLIKNTSFGSEFAYLDESNNLINSITTILDNGTHPNFILKAISPHYDEDVYPKLFKVNTQEELDVILTNVDSDYFLMPYYFNENKLENGHIQVVRSLNLLVPPNLESIQIGQYHKICNEEINNNSTYDSQTFEYIGDRSRYLTTIVSGWTPKLEDTDLVEMADGSFKTALDLQIGDYVKTIDIPNPFQVDNHEETTNYLISYEDLVSGTTYSTNKVLNKFRINRKTYIVNITFADDSNWKDVADSNYLVERNNEIKFLNTIELVAGDYLLLIDTSNNEFIKKEVSNITKTSEYLNGWALTVERTHLFLTKNSADSTSSYVSIEHNTPGYSCYCNNWNYYTCGICHQGCGKGEYCEVYSYTSYGENGNGICLLCS